MFQEALIESAPHRSWNGRAVVASAIAHSVIVVAIVWVSARMVGDVGEPPLPVRLEIGTSPPPLGEEQPSSSRRVHQRTSRPGQERFARAIPQIAERPRPVHQDAADARIDLKEMPSREDGGGSSSSIGDPNGAIAGTSQKSGTSGLARDAPIVISRDVHAPVLITQVEPVYPESARRIRLAGVVMLEAVIGASGRVENLRVTSSGGALLDAAAISAVEEWVYQPATLHGRAVSVFLTVSVTFALH